MLCSSIPLIFLVSALVLVSAQGKGRKCYECSTETSLHSCLYSPENVTETRNVVLCKHYCTIERKEYVNIPGTISIASLTRGCEKEPPMDGIVMSDLYITFYRSCKTHLCNTGDGTVKLPERNVTDEDYYDEENASPPVVVNPYLFVFTVVFPFYYFFGVAVARKQYAISHNCTL